MTREYSEMLKEKLNQVEASVKGGEDDRDKNNAVIAAQNAAIEKLVSQFQALSEQHQSKLEGMKAVHVAKLEGKEHQLQELVEQRTLMQEQLQSANSQCDLLRQQLSEALDQIADEKRRANLAIASTDRMLAEKSTEADTLASRNSM